MTATQPQVSVVIPSGRQVRLSFTLEALARQTLGRERFEVVVVQDGEQPAPSHPELDLRAIRGHGDGNIAALRNLGWRAARAPLIAFTDDDCRPAADWLERMLDAADGSRMLFGRTEPDPDEDHLLHGLARSQRIVELGNWYESCNAVYPRRILESLGGFDEDFARLGEDTDLALRAFDAGAAFRFVDRARVWHAVIPMGLVAALGQARRRDTIPLLIARHPRHRHALYKGVFWKRSHALVVVAALGLASRRPALALLAALPWVAENTDPAVLTGGRWRLLRQLGHLGARAAVDSTEVATTVLAAARQRTLVI